MAMHTVLLTAAGQSTRFPNELPKWSLTHPAGFMMAIHAVRGVAHDRLVVALNERDVRRFGSDNVREEFSAAGLVAEVINVGTTRSQVETAQRAVKLANITQAVTVRDCDSAFGYTPAGNSVAVVDLHTTQNTTPGNKSYVRCDTHLRVLETAEKRIIGTLFCCGAYSFADVDTLLAHADAGEYLSQVIGSAVRAGSSFLARPVDGYEDWGTLADWERFCAQWSTLFVDVDGVLVESGHRTFAPRWGETPQLAANITFLNQLHATGRVEIILTTARPEATRALTEHQLTGLHYDRLIMGLRTCPRLIVNDVLPARGTPTAHAVNLTRNGSLAPALRWLLR